MARKGKGMQGVRVGRPKKQNIGSASLGDRAPRHPSDHGPRTRHTVLKAPKKRSKGTTLGD